MKLNYTVIDVETTVHCPIGSNKANPHWPSNKLVLAGWQSIEGIPVSMEYTLAWKDAIFQEGHLLVGSNIPFDLQHLYKAVEGVYRQRGKFRAWDCQVAEYLLSQHKHKYPSLDDMSVKYGGTLKDDSIKKHWEDGGMTEDIDKDKLKEYNIKDVKNTHLIFKAQTKEAISRGMLPLIMAQMDAVMAVTEMQYNGIAINNSLVKEELNRLVKSIQEKQAFLKAYVVSHTDIPAEHADVNSTKSLSMILFGGTVNVKEKKLVGMYKNGSPKFKQETVTKTYTGFGLDTTGVEKTACGWSTSDKTLDALIKRGSTFAAGIQDYREKIKNYTTYYEPLTRIVFPDGCVHQNLNMTATQTGRLSCTEPNLQNITDKHKSEIKKVYVSRWGDKGKIVEVDYKQLEIVALAHLSKDKQLMADVNAGVDIHTELFKNMFFRIPTEWERKQFKRLSFALIYGSGIKNMAQQAMVSEDVAKNFKKTFENRYPGVVRYRESVRQELLINRVVMGAGYDKETKLPLASSHYKLPTGRELYYKEYVQSWTGKPDFSYTEICNYPVQSFATGDIVPIMIGKLWRWLVTSKYKEQCLLINTVHDSIMLDIHNDILYEVIPDIKAILEDVPNTMEKLFGFKMEVSPKVSISAGPNWFDQKEV